jgi:alpha-tubulin suppressor-like RCC1 family protein
MEDSTVWTWGVNSAGRAGQDSDSLFVSPRPLPELHGVIAISAANHWTFGGHVLALTVDGSVWAWGQNDKGQIGNGTFEDQKKPVLVEGLTDVVSIATGAAFSLAICADGSVWSWGDNSRGQLGTGDRVQSTLPVRVQGLPFIREIYAAGWTGVAIDDERKWYGWGRNYQQLIIGAALEDQLTPVQFPHPCSVSSVHEPEQFVALHTAPQPAQDVVTFTVALPEHSQISRLNIVDICSNTVKSITNIDGSATVDVTHLPSGVYVALAYDERGRLIATQSFVVVH